MSLKQIVLQKVDKRFGDVMALQQLSFRVGSGRHLAIIGSSGCGKSTLLRLIAGLDRPDKGEILINDELVSVAGKIIRAPHQRGVGLVFQDLALWPNLSVFENVALVLAAKNIARSELRTRVNEALQLCGVAALRNRKPSEISGGQQQRLALARAIVSRPDFLLLDEPFSGLDLITKQDLIKQITNLAQQQGITLVLVTHDPFEAAELAQDLIILEQGGIVESGTFDALLKHSATPIMQQFRRHIRDVRGV